MWIWNLLLWSLFWRGFFDRSWLWVWLLLLLLRWCGSWLWTHRLFVRLLSRLFCLDLFFLWNHFGLLDLLLFFLFPSLSSYLLDERIHSISRGLSINFFLLFLRDLNNRSLFLFDIDYGLDNLNLRNLWINICILGLPVYFFLLFIFLIFPCVLNHLLK